MRVYFLEKVKSDFSGFISHEVEAYSGVCQCTVTSLLGTSDMMEVA